MQVLKYFITLFLVLFSLISFSSSAYAVQNRAILTLPPLIQIPTNPPLPTMPKIEIKKGNAAVEIVSPEDKTPVKKEEKLPVQVHFNTSYIKAKFPNNKEKDYYLKPIQAVELLLDGKSYEVKQFKKPLKEGDTTFDVSFSSLPEDAVEAKLQAKIYTVYVPEKLPKIKGLKKLAAESEVVMVFFKQIIGPEGGIVKGTGNTQVIIPEGAFTVPTAIEINTKPETENIVVTSSDVMFLGAVNLDFEGTALKQLDIGISAPSDVNEEDQVLVAEVVEWDGVPMLELVDVAKLIDGNLVSQIENPLPGIWKKAQYVFYKVQTFVYPEQQAGYVVGRVFAPGGNSESVDGAVVTINKFPNFLSMTKNGGRYLIPGIIGPFAVTAFDPKTGNFKTQTGAISNKGESVLLDIVLNSPPFVIEGDLMNGSFEDGLNHWNSKGDARSISSLGSIQPTK